MFKNTRSIIQNAMTTVSMETQQMDVEEARAADVELDYAQGVDVAPEAAEDAVAETAMAATFTMEATPKELRNGMAVVFSHGHGKIARVFTAPFLLDKKHHKASKDAPLYLVKHDKGGKHSLHKASALRPRK